MHSAPRSNMAASGSAAGCGLMRGQYRGRGRCSVAASGDPKTPKPLIGARLVLAPQPRDLRCDRSRPDYLFFLGTFLPFLRALERPMAMACLRLLTLPPLPPGPLFAVPRL